MRITGGKAAGRSLSVPKGWSLRPTPNLVKQALFNSLGAKIVGAKVLELFAGSGALGLECLSRGAASVLFVEKSPRHAEFTRANASAMGFPSAAIQVRVQDVFACLPQLAASGAAFDLILADPPFGDKNVARRSASFAQQLLDAPTLPKLISGGCLFILGHARRDCLEIPAPWQEVKLLKHGDNILRFLECGPSA
jgi:16S rRNA (guanine966-N2)-methyltransferase